MNEIWCPVCGRIENEDDDGRCPACGAVALMPDVLRAIRAGAIAPLDSAIEGWRKVNRALEAENNRLETELEAAKSSSETWYLETRRFEAIRDNLKRERNELAAKCPGLELDLRRSEERVVELMRERDELAAKCITLGNTVEAEVAAKDEARACLDLLRPEVRYYTVNHGLETVDLWGVFMPSGFEAHTATTKADALRWSWDVFKAAGRKQGQTLAEFARKVSRLPCRCHVHEGQAVSVPDGVSVREAVGPTCLSCAAKEVLQP